MVDPHKLAKARKATAAKKAAPAKKTTAAKKAAPNKAHSRLLSRSTKATTDTEARTHITHLVFLPMQKSHQSKWSRYEVTLPSGRTMPITVPLKAAVAVEKAGYPIRLVGRLND